MSEFKVIESKTGAVNLYVFNADGCMFAERFEPLDGWLAKSVEQLRKGHQPLHDNWFSSIKDPARAWEDAEIDMLNDPADHKVIADEHGYYLNKMSIDALRELKPLIPRDYLQRYDAIW